MAVSLLDQLPEEDTPEREELESIARISCASGYAGSYGITNCLHSVIESPTSSISIPIHVQRALIL